jgi:hypothetical protein
MVFAKTRREELGGILVVKVAIDVTAAITSQVIFH